MVATSPRKQPARPAVVIFQAFDGDRKLILNQSLRRASARSLEKPIRAAVIDRTYKLKALIEILSPHRHLSGDRQPRLSIHNLHELKSRAPRRIHHYGKSSEQSREDPAFSGPIRTGFLLPVKPRALLPLRMGPCICQKLPHMSSLPRSARDRSKVLHRASARCA